jgi:hypothetical protein
MYLQSEKLMDSGLAIRAIKAIKEKHLRNTSKVGS